MQCGKLLSTWNEGYIYFTEIIFAIAFLILGILIAIFSIHSPVGLVFAIIFFIIGILIGFIDVGKGTPGKNTLTARLNEFCYGGYTRPFGMAAVNIDLKKNPRLLVIRYAYYFSPPKTFIPLNSPWQGWNLMFVYNGKIYWGPNVATMNYVRKDHVFMGSVIKRFRELNLEVEYVLLDPHYMDAFISSIKNYARENISLKEILAKTSIDNQGRMQTNEKIYEPPEDLERANIDPSYEELLPSILSK